MDNKKEVPQWQVDVIERIMKGKKQRFNQKFEQLKAEATEKLKELLSIYFQQYTSDEEENKHCFDILNDSWKEYVNKIRATKGKYIKLEHSAFEKYVETNISTPEFAEYLEKLKAEPVETNDIS